MERMESQDHVEPGAASTVSGYRPVSSWRSLIATHNPFFLLSGVCMLAGCFLINAAAHEDPDRLGPIVALLGVFNVYELLVLGLGLYLAKYRGRSAARDATLLLLLETLLLADFTFLYAEVFTKDFTIGTIAASLGAVLALMKVGAMVWVLRLRLSALTWIVLPVTLVMLFALPGVVRQFEQQGGVTHGVLYAGWWLAGLLLAGQAVAHARGEGAQGGGLVWSADGLASLRRTLGWVLPGLPWVSVVLHLAAAHWMYRVSFTAHDVAPLLLGAAVLVLRQDEPAGEGQRAAVRSGVALLVCVVAVWFSGFHTVELLWLEGSGGTGGAEEAGAFWTIAPLRLALLASVGVGAMSMWRRRGWVIESLLMLLALALVILGPMWASIGERLSNVTSRIRGWVPDTLLEWGVVVVVAAFVFLGVGGWFSLRRRVEEV